MGKTEIKIVIIAAVARNGVIGVDGGMPWHIPSDFAHFKRMTMGKPMIMGRKQYETLGRPLPGRVNIVVSRQPLYQPDGVIVFNDFDVAIEHAKTIAKADGANEIMIIGGGEIYQLGMAVADSLVISHVDVEFEETVAPELVLFPKIDPNEWKMAGHLPPIVKENEKPTYSIKVYHRIAPLTH